MTLKIVHTDKAPAAMLQGPYRLARGHNCFDAAKKLAAEQERYACRVTDESAETDSHGNVKKTTTELKEQFFVNGISVERTLSKNGKDLTPDETRKEDQRVMKETVKYSNEATARKENDKQNHQIEEVLSAMQLANGRRERVNGSSFGQTRWMISSPGSLP